MFLLASGFVFTFLDALAKETALILPVLVIISIFLLVANRAGALGRGEAG